MPILFAPVVLTSLVGVSVSFPVPTAASLSIITSLRPVSVNNSCFREFIFWMKKVPARIPEDFFFLRFPEEFFTGTWFWRGSLEFLFFVFTGFFCRNFCGTGIPVFTPDSSGIRRIPLDSCSRQIMCRLSSSMSTYKSFPD